MLSLFPVRQQKGDHRSAYLRHNAELANKAIKSAKKTLQTKQKRLEELSRLIQVAYEDRVKGNMPEDVCFGLIEKYSTEQKSLTAEIEEIETKMKDTETTLQSADAFIHNIKKYLEAPELTREMCYELAVKESFRGNRQDDSRRPHDGHFSQG